MVYNACSSPQLDSVSLGRHLGEFIPGSVSISVISYVGIMIAVVLVMCPQLSFLDALYRECCRRAQHGQAKS